MTETCESCRFFKRHFPDANPSAWGNCRFNPPTVVTRTNDIDNAWPDVRADQWCGKYEPSHSLNGQPIPAPEATS